MTTLHSPEALCVGMLADVGVTTKHMREVIRPRLDAILNPTQRELCVCNIFLRALCWMETLARLDRVQDFQAVAACTRFELEAAVDLVILRSDRNGKLTTKMEAWVTSTKFKAAENATNFYRARGETIPAVHQPLTSFYDNNRDFVKNLRIEHWGGRHPDRWTGSTLLEDCSTADGLSPVQVVDEMGIGLTEFYETEVRRLNWLIHGSGAAILGRAPAPWFFLNVALGLKWSSDLGGLVSALTMESLRFDEAIHNMDGERKRLRAERNKALFEQLGATRDTE
jgi:hypothetical protein